MIQAADLVEKFKYALENRWGYIWGTAGVYWTESRQKQKVDYMTNKYGTSWKKNSEAKQDNYYNAAVYGSKWIGHTVADCSGMFAWAFSKLGGSIAHGSNSIYDRYCTKKGKLTDDLKKSILPGTAVFTGTEKTHGHIGLYAGNGKVIEAANTQAGVCTSNITEKKWTFYGELDGVNYGDQPLYPVLRKGDKGEYVKKVQTILVQLGYDIGSSGIDGDFGPATEKAVKAFQKANGIGQDGVVGAKTWPALLNAPVPVKQYSILIHRLSKTQADDLHAKYPDSTVTIE